jgi:hypothetical protein
MVVPLYLQSTKRVLEANFCGSVIKFLFGHKLRILILYESNWKDRILQISELCLQYFKDLYSGFSGTFPFDVRALRGTLGVHYTGTRRLTPFDEF